MFIELSMISGLPGEPVAVRISDELSPLVSRAIEITLVPSVDV
jgi:hypothetical protein